MCIRDRLNVVADADEAAVHAAASAQGRREYHLGAVRERGTATTRRDPTTRSKTAHPTAPFDGTSPVIVGLRTESRWQESAVETTVRTRRTFAQELKSMSRAALFATALVLAAACSTPPK